MAVFIAYNETTGTLAIDNLSVPDAILPASASGLAHGVELTEWNTIEEIQSDIQLHNYVVSGSVVFDFCDSGVLDGTASLNALNTTVVITETTPDEHFTNFNNPHSTSVGNLVSGTLAELNAAISDATIDAAGSPRPATLHGLGDPTKHSGSTLVELNALISDATLDDESASRNPTGSAGGDLSGSYPNPTVIALTLDDSTRLMVNGISDGEVLVRSGTIITGTSSVPGGMVDHGLTTGLLDDDHPQYLPTSGIRAMSGTLDLGGNRIINVATPVSGTDAVNLDYLGAALDNISWKDPVLDKDLTAPPGGESIGDRYIPASPASGSWTGLEDYIVEWNGTSYDSEAPEEGDCLWVEDDDIKCVYNGTSWVPVGSITDHGNLLGLADDDHLQYLPRSGVRAMSGTLDMGTNNIINVGLVDGRDVSTDGATLDAHTASTSNPHQTNLSNLGSGTLAQLNANITDATLIDTADSRLSDDRDPNLHGLADPSRHSGSTLAELNSLISDATLDDSTASRPPSGDAGGDLTGSYPNPSLNAGSIDLSTFSGSISSGQHGNQPGGSLHSLATTSVAGFMSPGDKTTLDDISSSYNDVSSSLESHILDLNNPHSTSLGSLGSGTLAQLNSIVSDAILIDTTDSRLSDDRDPTLHGLADPTRHSGSTLAELNSLMSDATLDDESASRTPTGSAGGDLSGSYPNPEVVALTSAGTSLTVSGISDGQFLARSGSFLVGTGSASGMGESNTASNVGGGDGVFKQKSGADLEFKSLLAAGNITLITGSNTITISGSDASGIGAHGLGDPAIHTASTLAELNALVSDATLIDTGDSRLSDDRDPNLHGLADPTRHSGSTLAELNTLVTDATLIDTTDGRLSDDRDPNLHGLADPTRHSGSTLAELNALVSDATLIDTGDSRLSDARTPTGSASGDLSGSYPNPDVVAITSGGTSLSIGSLTDGQFLAVSGTTIISQADTVTLHGLGDAADHSASTLAELNALVSDATLIDTGDSRLSDDRDPNLHGLADPTRHSGSTLAELNTLISDATLIDTGDSRLSDDRDPNLHGLADPTRHSGSTLAELNSLISDATLIDTGDSRLSDDRDPNLHGLADPTRHSGSTLAELNSLVSDATLIDTGDSRLSDDRDPNLHGFGDPTRHSGSSLAEVNNLITDATLVNTFTGLGSGEQVLSGKSGTDVSFRSLSVTGSALTYLSSSTEITISASLATTSSDGLMSAADKLKLDDLSNAGATEHASLSSSVTVSTGGTTFVNAFGTGSMTPPSDGDYYIIFSGEYSATSGNSEIEIGVALNTTGSAVDNSKRAVYPPGSGKKQTVFSSIVLNNLVTSDSIYGVFRRSDGSGNAQLFRRRLIMIKVVA